MIGKMLGDHAQSMGKVGTEAMGCATFLLIGFLVLFLAPSPGWGFGAMALVIVLYFGISTSKRCHLCHKKLGGVGYQWELNGKAREVCTECNIKLKDEESAKEKGSSTSWLPPPKR
jgi:hypothetical protein